MNENKTVAYFAYGSSMDVEQMRNRCPSAKFNGVAVLPGYKFALDSEGCATVIPCEGKEVCGVLWSINKDGEKVLDRNEGVAVGCYGKEILEVSCEGYLSKFPVLVYVSRRGENKGERRNGYINKIVSAATGLGFDSSYLGMLKDIWGGLRQRGRPRAAKSICTH